MHKYAPTIFSVFLHLTHTQTVSKYSERFTRGLSQKETSKLVLFFGYEVIALKVGFINKLSHDPLTFFNELVNESVYDKKSFEQSVAEVMIVQNHILFVF